MSRATVVIPAHNEASVIAASLQALRRDERRHEFDVLVVANGCTDDTIGTARRADPDAAVLTLPHASKAAALNAGLDRMGNRGHVVFLDADTVVSPGATSAVLDLLDLPGVDTAAPRPRLVLEPATTRIDQLWSPLTRRYLEVWQQAPYWSTRLVGAGFAGVSAGAVHRLGDGSGRFPDLIADDLVVLTLSPSQRRAIAGEHWFAHRVPTSLIHVHRQEQRRQTGVHQFRSWARNRGIATEPELTDRSWLVRLGRSPRWTLPVLGYVALRWSAALVGQRATVRGALAWGSTR